MNNQLKILEESYLSALKNDDVKAFDILFSKYGKRLYYFAYGYLKSKEEATTLPEGYKFESSNIHRFMGAVDNFFHRHMVGINVDASNPGFQKIVLKPNFIKVMDFAKASYNSIYGEIKVAWKKIGKDIYEYSGEIPANCSATVVLPDKTVNITSGNFSFKISI